MNITDDNSTDDDEIVAHREERPQQIQQAQPQQPITPMNNHGQFGQTQGRMTPIRRYPQRQNRIAPNRLNDYVVHR